MEIRQLGESPGAALGLGLPENPATNEPTRSRAARPVVALALAWTGVALFVVGLVVAVAFRRSIDYPVMRFLEGSGGGWPLLERLLLAPGRFDVLGGPIFVAGVWLVWFDTSATGDRLRMISGTFAAGAAGAISRGLQLTLPTHPRPIHDPALGFVPPPWIDRDVLNRWDSFPSDHAALFFGLATVIFLVRPRLGALAFAWALLVDLNRVQDGIHFMSDVVGGAGLGIALVCLFQHKRVLPAFDFILEWSRRRPAVFYALAFLGMYEVANLFEGLRDLGHAVGHLLHS